MLTLKFYTKKINVYTNQHQLVKKWCKFLCKPEDSQPLIKGMTNIIFAELQAEHTQFLDY